MHSAGDEGIEVVESFQDDQRTDCDFSAGDEAATAARISYFCILIKPVMSVCSIG